MKLAFRTFVEVDSKERAEAVAAELARLVERVAAPSSSNVVRYWKIPEYFEILLELESGAQEENVVAAVCALLGSGWETIGENEAIWNHGPGSLFRTDVARWSHVEVLDP